MSTVADLEAACESIAPVRLAESWDNVGLLVGDRRAPVTRVLLAIDYTRDVAREARDERCDAVIAYHPPIFAPKKRVLCGDGVFEAIRDGIALYSPHTALDVAEGGTNDVLGDIVGLRDRAPLKAPAPGALGIGRIGVIDRAPITAVIARIKQGLGASSLLVSGPEDGEIERVAMCAGAGGELLDQALSLGAQLYLTGELRHHDALKAARAGVTIVCALHSNSERVTLARLVPRLEALLPGVAFVVSKRDRDPFSFRLPPRPVWRRAW